MIDHWLNSLSVLSLGAAILCALIVSIDLVRRPQRMAVMNVTWPITALYLGMFGLWAYFAFGRAATGDTMEHSMNHDKPMWRSVFVSATHCGGGCTVGDIIGEFAVYQFGWTIAGATLWPEYLVDFLLAYAFGVAFQYFAIMPMSKLTARQGIVAAIKADTLSLTAFEVGMFIFMAVVSLARLQPSLNPTMPTFWFMMQIAMVAGFVTSYPMNWWLIKKGIKDAM